MKTFTHNSKHLAAALATVCLASAAVVAHADTLYDVQAHTVGFSDLNLNTDKGAAALYQRIRKAAEQVCGDVDSKRLNEAAAAKACVDRAIQSSVSKVQNAQLTRVYDAHVGAVQTHINVASLR